MSFDAGIAATLQGAGTGRQSCQTSPLGDIKAPAGCCRDSPPAHRVATFLSSPVSSGKNPVPATSNHPTPMKKRPLTVLIIIVLLIVAVLAVLRFSGQQNSTGHPSPLAMSLTGTEGTRFTGYYVAGGQRVEITNALPWSVTATNLAHCEFRKADTNATFVFELRGDGLQMRATANTPDVLGLRAVEDGGWSFQVIR